MTDGHVRGASPSGRRRSRSFLLARLAFAAVAFVFLSGSAESCGDDMRPPTITCQDVNIVTEPGTCVPISNPCEESGRWQTLPRFDGLELCGGEEPEEMFGANPPFSLHTTRSGRDVTRAICVSADSPFFASLNVEYRYGLGVAYGIGSIFLTVGKPLSVRADADPPHLALGETSQLVAAVTGGVPPYFYSWVPSTSLNDADVAAPLATPRTTTEYSVRVTDSIAQEEIRKVTITVGTAMTVTADPEEIAIGDVAAVFAVALGGTPPFTYVWTPGDTLDDPYRRDPIAIPTTTTTYHVTAVDAAGATLTGSATVEVRLEAAAAADPPEVLAGGTTQLFAAVRGGTPPYTFTWTPAETLDDPSRQDPIAAPATATSYRVIARDAAGAAAGASVTVLVVGDDPPPTASFVFSVQCCPQIEVDATASTGPIVTYSWDLGWTSANPDRITTSPTASFPIREFDRGPITLTVTGRDGRTATATQIF